MSQYQDVIVVGAGVVGLSCALALAQRGLEVTVVEAQKSFAPTLPCVDDPFDIRVVAISRASEVFFQQCGVWSTMVQARVCDYQAIKVWDSVSDGIIHFWADEFHEPNLGHIIEQRVILSALWQALQSYPVKVITGQHIKALDGEKALAECHLDSGESLRARLIIAADGANSGVRSLLAIPSTQWSYEQSAIVATVKGEKSHQKTAFQRFSPEGPLALLPLANAYQSSIVWTSSPSQAKTLMQASPHEFGNILAREIDGVMGGFELIGERACFGLQTHHSKTYMKSRCILVGDAAHTLHPLAGQGVNLGLLDAAALVDLIDRAHQQGQDYGLNTTMNAYERKRRLHNQSMIWAMELFKRGFSSQVPMIQWLRNTGLSWVDRQLPIKHWFAKMAFGTALISKVKT